MQGYLKRLCVLAAVLMAPAAAEAAVLSWSASQDSVALAPGQQVTLSLFLNESGPNPTIAAEDGLLSVGYKISRTSGDATITAFTPNTAAFSQVTGNSFTAAGAQFYGEIPFSASAGPVPDGAGNIAVGTLQLTGGSTGSTFSFGDYGAGNQTVTVDGSGSLDASIQNESITTVVPEPTALGVALLAAPLLRRRRR